MVKKMRELTRKPDEPRDEAPNQVMAALSLEQRKALDKFGLLHNVSGACVQEVERLWKPRALAQGHVLCRKGAASTLLYFVLHGRLHLCEAFMSQCAPVPW